MSLGDTLDLSQFENIELPGLNAAIEDSQKAAPPPINEGYYLATITNAKVHTGVQKANKPGPSYNFEWELSVNRSTFRENRSDEFEWTPAEKTFDLRHWTWVGYLSVKNGVPTVVYGEYGFPRSTASFLHAAGADASTVQFNPKDYIGAVLIVQIKHEATSGQDGTEYINARINWAGRYLQSDGNMLRFEVTKSALSEDANNKDSNPFA